MLQTNPGWRTDFILKNRKKIAYLLNGLTVFDEIWHDRASQSLEPSLLKKFPHFKYMQDDGWPPLKIEKKL